MIEKVNFKFRKSLGSRQRCKEYLQFKLKKKAKIILNAKSPKNEWRFTAYGEELKSFAPLIFNSRDIDKNEILITSEAFRDDRKRT